MPLAACESEPEVAETDTTIVETPDPIVDEPMMDDTTMDDAPEVTPQATVDAVTEAGGLTSLAPAAAVSNIDAWIDRLEGNPDFAPVVADLETLRSQLQASPIDGAAVGATLQSLGQATTAAAAGDGALETLGTTLTDAGNSLAGM
ncbi:hypothetical protein BSZ37_20115 [Rubrivirga marina]|uniref:Uncharacterized protein n=1 Tax=Rubrivirga marina TaxID=1196024 RepID=A0A271J4W6_9BACT|nr:hypothetical protein BSZ37_20115 [Rubrivirga marina]